MGIIVLTHHKYTCCIHIYPVNDSRPEFSIYTGKGILKMVHQSVDQSPTVVSRCRMNHHSLWFIHKYHVIILIYDVERYILRLNVNADRIRHRYIKNISGTYTVARL